MTTFERIKELSKKRNLSIQTVAEELGFSKNLFYKWKTTDPKAKDLQKVADYFNVSTDYLLGRDEPTKQNHNFTVEEALESVMSYDGKPLTDNDREVLRGIVEGYLNNKGNA